MRLALDCETFCELPITVGSYRYAEECEIMLISYAIDDEPAEVLDLTAQDAKTSFVEAHSKLDFIRQRIDEADEIVIQNSAFDRIVFAAHGITIPVEKIVDTLVIALLHSLPGKLEQLCDVLGVPTDKAKDKAGKKLIQLFCKPRPKNMKLRRATRETHPEEWAQFIEYARQDIPSMLAVLDRLPKWNWTPEERGYWLLDQRINDRGVRADLDLAKAALRAFDRTKADLNERTAEMTDGAVGSLTQRDRFMDYLDIEHDFRPVDMTKGTVAAILKRNDLSTEMRELLTMRQQAAAASPAKYRSVLNSACKDGRLRGMTQFCGASRTGRDAGRIVQLQNLPRPTLKPHEIEAAIEAIKLDCEDLLYENVSELCVNAVRGCLVSEEDRKLVVSDLSNIEGRILAWLASEDWKIRAFEDYDAGRGHDLYKLTAGRILNKRPEDITKNERQAYGKVPELALGYQGSIGAFLTMGANYGVNLPEDEVLAIVRGWRAAHPGIKQMWYDLERAAINAIWNPDNLYRVGKLSFDVKDGYLRMRLPSGRYLSYRKARVITDCRACEGTGKIAKRGSLELCDTCYGSGNDRPRVQYDGVNQYTRKWETIDTYGGKFAEQACQATARDVFFNGLKLAEENDYRVVVRVHDELLTEVPDDPRYDETGLSAQMTRKRSWMLGLPLAAAGHSLYRYAKVD